jgi:hypothetical protein
VEAVVDGEEYLGAFGEGWFAGFAEMGDLFKQGICSVTGVVIGAGFKCSWEQTSSSRPSMPGL